MPRKIAIIADAHFGRKHRFEVKLPELALQAMRKALQTDFDGLVIAGDIFHTGTPHPTLIAEVMRILREGLKGRPCVIIYGNHDATRIGSAIDPLRQMGDTNILIPANNEEYRLAGYRVWVENWPTSAKPGTVIKRELDDVDLAVVHGSLLNHPNSPRDDWQYDISGARLVVAGHLHAPSFHEAGNYPGSLIPGSFAESHTPGFLMFQGGTLTRVEVDVPIKFTTLTAAQAQNYEPAPGEVIRASVSKPEHKAALERSLRERGAIAEVTLVPQSSQIRAEAAAISEKATMSAAYESYLKGTGGDTTLLSDAKEFFHDFNVE